MFHKMKIFCVLVCTLQTVQRTSRLPNFRYIFPWKLNEVKALHSLPKMSSFPSKGCKIITNSNT